MNIPSPARLSLSAIASLVLILAGRPALAADAPSGADWVSPDAIIHVEATRPTLLLDRFLSDSVQNYLKVVPPYQRYLEGQQYKQQKAQLNFIATLLDTEPEKGLRDLLGGGAVLSLELVDKKPAIVLIVTPKDAEFLKKAHKKLIEISRADATGKGKPDPVKTTEYQGITTYSLAPTEAHAIVNNTLVVTNVPSALKVVIDRSKKGQQTGKKAHAEVVAQRAQAAKDADTIIWGFVDLTRLRSVDKKFSVPDKLDPGATFLFGPWAEAARKAPWVTASIRWGEQNLTADVKLPAGRDTYSETFRRYLPPKGEGAPGLLAPKGVIGNFSLWRDLSSIWEVRNDIFPPQTVQNLAQLDSFAGQFFGGRDFGSGVLGSLGTNWRLVAAEQDYSKMKPVPDVKLPAFALVIDLKPDDEEFSQRLRVAFQSFIGLVNIGAAQQKAPPLESGSETVDGVTILTTHYLAPNPAPNGKKEPVHQRHNFSPSAMQVGNTFVLASSLGLARDLVPLLKTPSKSRTETAILDVDGRALARLVEVNKTRLVMQNMLEKGNDRSKAEGEIGFLEAALGYVNHATLTASDANESLRFLLNIKIGGK